MLATVIIGLFVAILFTRALVKIIRQRKSGGCGCGCTQCSHSCSKKNNS